MHPLDDVNRTELVEMARAAGAGNLGRSVDRADVYAVLEGKTPAPARCTLETKRKMMEKHIQANWRQLRTQLPCGTGKCVTHGCPDIIVQRCWRGMSGDML